MRQLRPRNRATAGIADHSREITDDKNGLMAKVLKLSQFSQNNGVTEVNIRGRRIDSELYPQRAAEREFVAQFVFADDLCRALL